MSAGAGAAEGFIDLAWDGAIARLRIARPDKLNALNAEMVAALSDTVRDIDRCEAVRLVIISGEGRAFSAGGDIDAWSSEPPRNFGRRWIRDGHAAFDALARLRQPVIALISGHAMGGGLELAACADLRIAEAHVKLGQPETGLGVIPGWSGTQRAVRRFGATAVRRMALFGEIFDAHTACALGIVDRVVETGAGEEAAAAFAERLLANDETATEITKMLINAAEGEERDRVLEAFGGEIAAGSARHSAGLQAYLSRRSERR